MVVPDTNPDGERWQQDNMIIDADLSRTRVKKFLADYLVDRGKSATAEMLFDRASAYLEELSWDDEAAFGFNVLLHKGPFVDDSSWFEYRTWPFAVAIQRRLFSKVEEALLAAAQADSTHGSGLADILQAADDLAERLRARDYEPSLIIVAGPRSTDLAVEFWKHPSVQPDWELDWPSKLWILGAYKGIAVVEMPELSRSGLYVADVKRLGSLTRHGDYQFEVSQINEDRAREIQSDREAPEDKSTIRSLLLQAHLKLYESFSVELRDQTAVLYSTTE
jgi:hypothetical protein